MCHLPNNFFQLQQYTKERTLNTKYGRKLKLSKNFSDLCKKHKKKKTICNFQRE